MVFEYGDLWWPGAGGGPRRRGSIEPTLDYRGSQHPACDIGCCRTEHYFWDCSKQVILYSWGRICLNRLVVPFLLAGDEGTLRIQAEIGWYRKS